MWTVQNNLNPLAFNYLSDYPDRLDFNDAKTYKFLNLASETHTNLTLFNFSFESRLENTLLTKDDLDTLNLYKTFTYLNNSEQIKLTSFDGLNSNTYLSDFNLYTSELNDLHILTTNTEDIYVTLRYEIDNITSLKDVLAFLNPISNIYKVYLKDSGLDKEKLIPIDLLDNHTFQVENQLIIDYRYKIYDHLTGTKGSLLYFDINLQTREVIRSTHNEPDYDRVDICIYDDKLFHRAFSIKDLTDTKKRFIINSNYVFLLI